MEPDASARKRTPTSIGWLSFRSVSAGSASPKSEQGHVRPVTVTATPADGALRLPLSSAARLRIVTWPAAAGVHA